MTTETFVAPMVGIAMPLESGHACDWSISVTGSAAMILQKSDDLETWQTIETRSATSSGSYVNIGSDATIRWKCNSINGTTVATIEV